MHAEVTRIRRLPDGFDALVAESAASGFRALARMRAAWEDGSNRFERVGEGLWAVSEGGRLLGICGLNVDPYRAEADVGRLRHLYVAVDARRRGIGRALVGAAMGHARTRFTWVRLRTYDPVARRFYEGLGFTRPPAALSADATHARECRDRLDCSEFGVARDCPSRRF